LSPPPLHRRPAILLPLPQRRLHYALSPFSSINLAMPTLNTQRAWGNSRWLDVQKTLRVIDLGSLLMIKLIKMF
jgi:hypothetical protein